MGAVPFNERVGYKVIEQGKIMSWEIVLVIALIFGTYRMTYKAGFKKGAEHGMSEHERYVQALLSGAVEGSEKASATYEKLKAIMEKK